MQTDTVSAAGFPAKEVSVTALFLFGALSGSFQKTDRMGGDALAPSGEAQPLLGGGLDTDVFGWDHQHAREVVPHGGKVRKSFGF